tara:strand:+ start:919 stop:1287 length:369 start_codon:yes stop_codon:yes gene_type:complete
MNNAQKFDQLKEEIKLFIEEKKVDGLIDSDIKKEIAKPENKGGFGVTIRTAQRWFLLLNEPTLGDYETIQNIKEVIRKGSSLINENLERLVLSEDKEERETIKEEIEIVSKALKGVNTIKTG